MSRRRGRRRQAQLKRQEPEVPEGTELDAADVEPDWGSGCEVCGATPVIPVTGMCGPCTFGEADTAGGNW